MIRASLLTVALSFLAAPASADDVYTLVSALREIHQHRLDQPDSPPRRVGIASSAAPGMGADLVADPIRIDRGQRVLLDIQGPGVVTRLWTANPEGTLNFHWDGAVEPTFSIAWRELVSGRIAPFEEPFIAVDPESGALVLFPLPFAGGIRITVSREHSAPWEVEYHLFPPETPVSTWTPRMGPPPGAPDEFSRAEQALLSPTPQAASPVLARIDVAVEDGATSVYTPDTTTLVEGVSLRRISGDSWPDALMFVYTSADTPSFSVPWNLVVPPGVNNRILQSSGAESSFHLPFLMSPGDAIGFAWKDGAEGDFAGTMTLTGAPTSDDAPRLDIRWASGSATLANPLEVAATGSGRLMAVNARVRDDSSAQWFARAALSISIDDQQTITPSANWVSDEQQALFSRLLRLPRAAATTVNLAPPERLNAREAEAELLLVSQVFGDVSRQNPPDPKVTLDPGYEGQLTSLSRDGIPAIQQTVSPVSIQSSPRAAWLDSQGAASGVMHLTNVSEAVHLLDIHLDLPIGWRGMLSDGNRETEVMELGWPFLRYETEIPRGGREFHWSVQAPENATEGLHVAQLRLEARLPEGRVQHLRQPIELFVLPRREPILVIRSAEEGSASGTRFLVPDDFIGRPGDLIVADVRNPRHDLLLRFQPYNEGSNMDGRSPEVAGLVPADGTIMGIVAPGDGARPALFPVGRHASWIPGPRELFFENADVAEVRVYHRAPTPAVEGWSRRVPYAEWPESSFRVPRYTMQIRGEELLSSMRIANAFPGSHLDRILVDTEFLENVEEGPLRWRLSNPPRRVTGFRPRIDAVRFVGEHTGARIIIEHPAIEGAQHFGIQFGYSPWSGRVGIRDSQGRLIAEQDIAMERTVNFPQFTWFAFPVPSQQPRIYIETLGNAPGGVAQHVLIERFMVLPAEPE